MTYSSTGTIQSTDYNNFLNGSNQINTVWGVGAGNAGYGQGNLTAVAATDTVTATQWATLINAINSTLTHQSGSGSGISAPTAGATATYLSTLASSINTSYTNRLNAFTQGSTTTGLWFWSNISAAAGAAYKTIFATRTITFASGNAARYFFNAGGQIKWVVASVTNGPGATARSGDGVTIWGTNMVSGNIKATVGQGRSGTGGTAGTLTSGTNNTNLGYYNLATTANVYANVVSTTASYTTDYGNVAWRSNGTNLAGSGDKGSVIYIDFGFQSPAHSTFNGVLNVNLAIRVDIIYPETTNLSGTAWGTPTIT